jgi:GT2 family glycosyltransferase
MSSLVTIGIPTYNRPELLRRALDAVARQDHVNLEVIVADNATPGDPNAALVDSYRGRIPGLRYVRHSQNIGSLPNFMFLLGAAHGEYFMWLADDDEISPDYVSSLASLLDSDATAAAAAGHWILMEDEKRGRVMPTSSFPQRYALVRALRFIWHSDDAFFYALHRTACLRQATFPGYWWPNRGVFLNWAYVYLLDVVLRGRVVLASRSTVQFINHDYTQKSYALTRRTPGGVAADVLRRLNVHVLFWRKCVAALSPIVLPAIMAASLASFTRQGAVLAARLRRSRVAGTPS